MSNNFVVDNSVVMSWCFRDESNLYADKILDMLTNSTAYVPYIWTLEVLNVLLTAERRKRINETDSIRFLHLLSQLPVSVQQLPPEKTMNDIFILARSVELSSYDAAYLDLAIREELPLATLDQKLIKAAVKSSVTILR